VRGTYGNDMVTVGHIHTKGYEATYGIVIVTVGQIYTKGYEASVAMPQLLPQFLLILM